MSKTLDTLRARRVEQDSGFTLIELLVVVVIIGILVGIAIPVYLNYRRGAENKSAESDVRSGVSAAEQYYTSHANFYAASVAGVKSTSLTLGVAGAANSQVVAVSDGNTVNYALAADGNSYKMCGQNADGGTIYLYDSLLGGPVGVSAVATLTATCS